VTSSLAVFEDAIWAKINALYKIMFKHQKKRKCGNKRNFYIKFHVKDCFRMEFTAL